MSDYHDAHVKKIAQELALRPAQVQATAALLAEGSTVPFIARYRKEVAGSLDEVAITAIRDRLAQLTALDQRRQAILRSLEERGLLADDLRARLEAAETLAALEEVYLPFRSK
ncbi:MAG TPA: Tex-like N-terminal domain-containing protein, partial [Chloroflexota bacterium]|nr:Tex-like N-terminal domain-containing protein [Chloroflexota bacterium]